MRRTWPVAGLAVALILCGVAPLAAQPPIDRAWPSAPRERGGVATGLTVSPFFEGWYENPDGSYTLSFGFFNRNIEEVLQIPQGPANFIEPAAYDGRQPTLFTPRRDTGIFTVTIPGDYARNDGRVVWTLHTPGHDEPHSVPGRAGVEAYRLHYIPMAMGSLQPMLKLQEDGPELWGPMTLAGDAREASTWASGQNPPGSVTNPLRMTATVGTPLTLTVWVADRIAPDAEREPVAGGARWFTHRGPALATFGEQPLEPDADGRATTAVTFSEPGEYLIRVRADNFNPVDSTTGDQCCWTNGYVAVTVSP